MKRFLLSILIVGTVTFGVIQASSAYFSDSETSTNNSFTAGEFDLLVDGLNDPEGIVSFDDLKPGDNYIEEKTLTIQNQAYIYLHLIDYESGPGILTEPEEFEESEIGEKHDLENHLTYDLTIDGETLIAQDDDIPFPDVFSCWIPLGVIEPGDTIVEQSFHFDESVTNWAQGDTLTFSEEYYAEQTRNNDNPTPPDTGSGRVWDAVQKQCIECEEGQTYASSIISSSQGLKKNGSPVNTNRSITASALGAPDTISVSDPKWFSLGFGGEIVLKFSFPITNGTGTDLLFHEITGGRNSYPLEKADVRVSEDGITWQYAGEITSEPGGDGVVAIDLSTNTSYSQISYVEITDTSDSSIHNSSADGYDLDAVEALYGTCSE